MSSCITEQVKNIDLTVNNRCQVSPEYEHTLRGEKPPTEYMDHIV
jgi:hypothetical protein